MATRRKFAVRKSLRRRPKKSKLPATSRARVKKTKKPHYVYYFGDGHADGSGGMKPLLGGKGANLHEMTRIGLPVPPGFTITTEVCTHFYAHNRTYPRELEAEVAAALAKVENSVGKKFGLLPARRSEEHTSELQSPDHLVCRLLLEKKKTRPITPRPTSHLPNKA